MRSRWLGHALPPGFLLRASQAFVCPLSPDRLRDLRLVGVEEWVEGWEG
jgi:hypothetical protein